MAKKKGLLNKFDENGEKIEKTAFGKILSKAGELVPAIAGEAFDVVVRGESPLKAVGDLIDGMRGEVANPQSSLTSDQKLELERLTLEAEQNKRNYEVEIMRVRTDLYKSILQDKASAREMYSEKSDVSDRIAMRIINWNLPILIALVAGEVACVIYLKDFPKIGMVVTAAIGMLIQAFVGERQQVVSFFFGSSLGSKMKTMLNGKEG
jgi:hypothetical protein